MAKNTFKIRNKAIRQDNILTVLLKSKNKGEI